MCRDQSYDGYEGEERLGEGAENPIICFSELVD